MTQQQNSPVMTRKKETGSLALMSATLRPTCLCDAQNCSLVFTGNWLHNATLDQHEQCSALAGNQVVGTVNVTQGMALPAAAQAVVAAAGPRT